MTQICSKLKIVGPQDGYPAGGIAHWCPACGVMHVCNVDHWDGDPAHPTMTEPRKIEWGGERNPAFAKYGGGRCHYTLIGGELFFRPDCTHKLASDRVMLPDLPGHLTDEAKP